MSESKVLIMTGDAAESLEMMCPYERLLEEGYALYEPAERGPGLYF